jgi:hypothetical protein
MALLARPAGVDREPDDAVLLRGGLRLLHVAALIMLLHIRAAGIVPFENDDLALELIERHRLAVRIREPEIGRLAADRRRGEGRLATDQEHSGYREQMLHHGLLFSTQVASAVRSPTVSIWGRIFASCPGG